MGEAHERAVRAHGPASQLERVLHPQAPESARPWRYLPLVLALAFAVRAGVALSGDFVLHPDEIMQYLEPAHRLVFGSGVVFWEYFYGARSWLVPGLVAAVLALFDALGLDEPRWYVAGVKLAFCTISLAIPAGMYFFARGHFGEAAARAALVAGAFWYELVGFAHKPLTEFVATAPLMALLALTVRPAEVARTQAVWPAAALAILAGAIRLQYVPIAALLLGIVLMRTAKRMRLVLIAAGLVLAVGIFDAVAWDGRPFHSYVTNVLYNLILGSMRAGESPPWQYLEWLVLAGGGLGVLCIAGAAWRPGRYGLLLALIALTLAMHSVQSHKEYRFVFAVVPLWLLIAADLTARAGAMMAWRAGGRALGPRRTGPSPAGVCAAVCAGVFGAVSVAGILNALPGQDRVYRAWSGETGATRFVVDQDPIFAAYRYLAAAPGVEAVWQLDRGHHQLPGYYYLHRAIPFYDGQMRSFLERSGTDVAALASHLVTEGGGADAPRVRLFRGAYLRHRADSPPRRGRAAGAPVAGVRAGADLRHQRRNHALDRSAGSVAADKLEYPTHRPAATLHPHGGPAVNGARFAFTSG